MIELYAPLANFSPFIDGYQFAAPEGNNGVSAFSDQSQVIEGPSAGYVSPLLAVPAIQQTGVKLQAFGGDFFERLHISTTLLALGNVIGLQTNLVNVWNAYTRAQVLTAINEINTEGITITGGPGVTPYQFAPLQEQTYTITVSTDGPPTIDATYTWNFAPNDLVLAVTGSRITAWSFEPDWSNGVVERIEWSTDVLQSFNAKEQRRALRLAPRSGYEFEAVFEGKARRYAEHAMWGWGARVWALPIWQDGQALTSAVAAGATEILIPTTGRDFEAGSLAIVLDDPFTFETLEIQSVSSDRIALKRGTTGAWPKGVNIYPARTARMQDRVALPRWTGDVSGARMSFDVTEPIDYTASAATTYRGYPVLTQQPNWEGGLSTEMQRKLAELDNLTGLRAYEDESGLPSITQRMRWTFTSKAELATFRGLLYTLRGRHGAVWVPSRTLDFVPVALIGNGSTAIDVEWSGYELHVNLATGREDIRIELTTGAVYYRRITGASQVNANTERLTIDTTLGLDVTPDQVASISFLSLMRLDSDAVEVAHWSGDVSDVAASMRGFQHDV